MATLSKRKSQGGRYYIRWISNGKVKSKSTKMKSLEKAMLVFNKWKEDKGLLLGYEFTVSDLFNKRLEYVSAYLKPRTLSIYKSTFKHFMTSIGNKSLSLVIPDDLHKYISIRLLQVNSVSVNIECRTLKATFSYACSPFIRMLKDNPFKYIPYLKIEDQKKVYIPDHHIRLILDHTNNPLIKDVFSHALLTACRLGEIINLKYKDVNLRERILYIRETKTGTPREIPISDKLMDILSKYFYDREGSLIIHNQEDRIYNIHSSTCSHKFKSITRKLQLPDSYKFHSLRHTAITNLLRNSKNVRIAQYIAGHTSIKTTQLYLHNIPEEVRAAVNTL